jgi:hypothetical protein
MGGFVNFNWNLLFLVFVCLSNVGCKQYFAERKVKENLRKFENNAYDHLKTEKVDAQEVAQFFDHTPSIPSYRYLLDLQKKQKQYQNDAEKFSTDDKVKHCYLGYIFARNYDLRTAIFMSYYKEAQDVGDGKSDTHFEIADMIATRAGGHFYRKQKPLQDCHEINETLERRVALFRERAYGEPLPEEYAP